MLYEVITKQALEESGMGIETAESGEMAMATLHERGQGLPQAPPHVGQQIPGRPVPGLGGLAHVPGGDLTVV